jgi:putative addiction module component (TIGR02574 family)
LWATAELSVDIIEVASFRQEETNMTEVALRLKDQILRLSEDDRVELAILLWESTHRPDDEIDIEDAVWIAELERRAADLKAGRAIAEPAEEVIAELREEALREEHAR